MLQTACHVPRDMNLYKISLDVPTAAGVGAPKPLRDIQLEKCVQVAGTFTANLSIEVSLDGTHYQAVVTGVTAPGIHQLPYPAATVRVRTVSFASGAPVVTVAGYGSNG